jgi:SPP1 gp7 family putative phage head morphogenesis protein
VHITAILSGGTPERAPLLNAAEKAFQRVFKHGYKPEDLFKQKEFSDLINKTKAAFNPAIEFVQSDVLKSYLDRDAFVFSGLKAHKQLTQARSLLKDEKGGIRPYYQFEQEIVKLNNTYNKLYLEAEYEFAVQSAQSADSWDNLSGDTDRYWLQYRTAKDERVREDHAALAGTTLPKTDPFWDSYYPPNGWRCRCVAVEVLASKNTLSDSKEAIKKGEASTTQIGENGKNKLEMFRFNPGKQQKLFPPKNSYMPRGCGGKKLSHVQTHGRASQLAYAAFLALDDEACRAKKIIEQMEIRKQRVELRVYAKKNLKGKTFQIASDKAVLNTRGIKEIINQPHKFEAEKNMLLLDFEKVCKSAVKNIKPVKNTKEGDLVKYFHYYEIELKGQPSWIVVREMDKGEMNIYSIVDSLKAKSD